MLNDSLKLGELMYELVNQFSCILKTNKLPQLGRLLSRNQLVYTLTL